MIHRAIKRSKSEWTNGAFRHRSIAPTRSCSGPSAYREVDSGSSSLPPPRVVAGAPYAYFVHKHEARSFRGSRNRQQKKSKKRYKCSCGFFRLRLDHGHRRGGLIRSKRGRAISSVGRAPRLHRGCREFESLIAHHFLPKKNITEPAAFVTHVSRHVCDLPFVLSCFRLRARPSAAGNQGFNGPDRDTRHRQPRLNQQDRQIPICR